MTQIYNVTIAKNIDANHIRNCSNFPFGEVIDLRCKDDGSARPIAEIIIRRMNNFWINYEQMPMDMSRHSREQGENLAAVLTTTKKRVLVLVDNIGATVRFCSKNNIACKTRDLYLVEKSPNSEQIAIVETLAPRFAKLAS